MDVVAETWRLLRVRLWLVVAADGSMAIGRLGMPNWPAGRCLCVHELWSI